MDPNWNQGQASSSGQQPAPPPPRPVPIPPVMRPPTHPPPYGLPLLPPPQQQPPVNIDEGLVTDLPRNVLPVIAPATSHSKSQVKPRGTVQKVFAQTGPGQSWNAGTQAAGIGQEGSSAGLPDPAVGGPLRPGDDQDPWENAPAATGRVNYGNERGRRQQEMIDKSHQLLSQVAYQRARKRENTPRPDSYRKDVHTKSVYRGQELKNN